MDYIVVVVALIGTVHVTIGYGIGTVPVLVIVSLFAGAVVPRPKVASPQPDGVVSHPLIGN